MKLIPCSGCGKTIKRERIRAEARCNKCCIKYQREYNRKYRQRPEVRARKREYMREYHRKYRQRPEVRARKREYMREYQREWNKKHYKHFPNKLAKDLCKYNLSNSTKEAFLLNGVVLDTELKKRGIVK